MSDIKLIARKQVGKFSFRADYDLEKNEMLLTIYEQGILFPFLGNLTVADLRNLLTEAEQTEKEFALMAECRDAQATTE